ncbi:MAG: ABC transporter permease subunit [Nocardioidaceae bacterium]
MRLLTVELRRLISRRAVVILMLLCTLGAGAIAAGTIYNSRPVSAAEIAAAQREADEMNREPWMQRQLERCERSDQDGSRCERNIAMRPEYLLTRQPLDPTDWNIWLLSMAALVGAIGVLIGATFIGADYASGSLTTQLLFQPSRLKVWGAKAGALLIGIGALALLSLGGANLALWLAATAWDRPLGEGLVGDWSAGVGRSMVFAALASVVGFAIVVLARHTAAALGLIAVYALVFETVVRGVWPGSERWLPSNHFIAWVQGRWRVQTYGDCSNNGRCRPVVTRFDLLDAAVYLGLLGLVIALASLLVFRRRDVA